MMRRMLWLVLWLGTLPALAAELTFDLDLDPAKTNTLPAGWRPALAGTGAPSEWRLVLDDAPEAVEAPAPGAATVAKRPVLAQVSTDSTDERFPLLVYEEKTFGDFRLTLRFKTVAGVVERMAGVAFRLQDERNFYVVRASALGGSFRFYRVFNGVRDAPIGPAIPVTSGAWHELTIEATGNRFRLQLDGQVPIPELTDSTFREGKIALWTKSDSVSYFADLRLQYTPREPLAHELVQDALAKYPRLRDLRVYAGTTRRPELHVVGAKDPANLGEAGGDAERDVIARNLPYAGKGKRSYLVTLPLHDINGDPIAAVRVELESFAGQTEDNAMARAMPVVRRMQRRVTTLKDLTE